MEHGPILQENFVWYACYNKQYIKSRNYEHVALRFKYLAVVTLQLHYFLSQNIRRDKIYCSNCTKDGKDMSLLSPHETRSLNAEKNQCQFQVFFVTNIVKLHAKTWNLHLCTFSAHTIPSTKQRIKVRIWNLHGGAIYFRFFSLWENNDICIEV